MGTQAVSQTPQGFAYHITLAAGESVAVTFPHAVDWVQGAVSWQVFPAAGASVAVTHALLTAGDYWTPNAGSPYIGKHEDVEAARINRLGFATMNAGAEVVLLSLAPLAIAIT